MNHGVTDWTTQLAEAENDVNRWLEVNWYNKTFTQGFDQIGRAVGSEMDATLLTDTQWTRATVYRALYAHILPTLSPFAVGGDTFREMIDFYRERFHEEMDLEIGKGVEYDLNNDGTISRTEKHKHRQDRIYR
jgi:hypothetical protein